MSEHLRVLTYNIHKGFNATKRKFVLKAIREALRTLEVDLVFLQEVHGEHKGHASRVTDWPDEAQFEFLADSVWHHYAYGKNAVYDEGHHGNALLSKFPIVEWWNENVSANRMEKRGVLHAVIQIPGTKKRLHCLCAHLGLTGRARKYQLEKICARIAGNIPAREPVLLAGDFNDWRLTATRVLEREGFGDVFKIAKGKHVATFPSRLPVLRLDRIYCRGLEVCAVETLRGKPWSTLSDHIALWAELKISRG